MKSFNLFNRVPNGPRVARNLLIAVACILSFTNTASAQAVKLKLKYQPGDAFLVQSKEKVSQRVTLGGRDDVTNIEGLSLRLVETGKPNDKGEFTHTHTVRWLSRNVSKGSNGPTMKFDSRKPNATDSSAFPGGDLMISALKARAKTKTVYLYDQSNKLLKVAVEGISPDKMPEAIRGELQPAKLKAARLQQIQALPSKPVSPGDSWEHKSNMSLGAGQTLKLVTKYTYKGKNKLGDREFDYIETEVTGATLTADDAPAGAPQLTESNVRPVKSTSRIWFDRDAGRIAAADDTLQVVGSITLSFGGQTIDADLDFKIETKMAVKPVEREAGSKK